MKNWEKIVVSPTTTIIDVMKVMNLTGKKIVLVAGETGKFFAPYVGNGRHIWISDITRCLSGAVDDAKLWWRTVYI